MFLLFPNYLKDEVFVGRKRRVQSSHFGEDAFAVRKSTTVYGYVCMYVVYSTCTCTTVSRLPIFFLPSSSPLSPPGGALLRGYAIARGRQAGRVKWKEGRKQEKAHKEMELLRSF